MTSEVDQRDADSPLVITSYTIERIGDIKRGLSTRANNARRKQPWSVRELRQMARLYNAVDLVDIIVRDEMGAARPGPIPEWVNENS